MPLSHIGEIHTITATCSAINKKENVFIKKKKEKENKLFFKKGRKNPPLTYILTVLFCFTNYLHYIEIEYVFYSFL